jgi:DNA-binding GntR family transcriptional regulator
VWRTTEPLLRTYITISARGGDPAYVADLHRPLLDALRSREPSAVEAAVRNHFAEAAALLARTWPHQDPAPAPSPDRAPPPRRRAG